MKRAGIGLLLLAGALVFMGAGAAAQTDQELSDKVQQCINDPNRRPSAFGRPPSCTFDSKGNLIRRDYDDPGFGGSNFGGIFATFFILAIVWAAIPLVIAVNMAKSRGDSAATPVLYTLAGGWLGLALYHATTRNRVTGEAAALSDVVTPTRPRDITARLRALDELLAAGTITAEEHDSRRASILQEI